MATIKTTNLMKNSERPEFSTGNQFAFVELVGAGASKLLRFLGKEEVANLLDRHEEEIDAMKSGEVIQVKESFYDTSFTIRFRKETESCHEMLQNIRVNFYA